MVRVKARVRVRTRVRVRVRVSGNTFSVKRVFEQVEPHYTHPLLFEIS